MLKLEESKHSYYCECWEGAGVSCYGSWKDYTFKEDNIRYLKQCYYNLQEKYDRGIITKEEWKLIHKNIYGMIKEEK